MKNVRIGDILIEYGYITADQLDKALAYQKEHRELRIGQALQALGFVSEKQVLEALAKRLGLRMVDFAALTVDDRAVEKLPRELAVKYTMLVIGENGPLLTLAVNDPLNYYGIEDIRQLTGRDLEIVLAEEEPLKRAISYYYAEISARRAARSANDTFTGTAAGDELAIDMTVAGDDDAPIIRLLNSLVQRASTTGASDIHIEPFEQGTVVRMRVDGVMVKCTDLQRAAHQPLIARIKIMSNLDIAEHRIPQDGHFRARLDNGLDVNVRVCPSCPPCSEKRRCCVFWPATPAYSTPGSSAWMTRPFTGFCRCWTGPTASSTSPAPPAAARPPRCTWCWNRCPSGW